MKVLQLSGGVSAEDGTMWTSHCQGVELRRCLQLPAITSSARRPVSSAIRCDLTGRRVQRKHGNAHHLLAK